jgi:membrane-bound metal-dependent hydrolase YbcI (DUF457 family)
MPQAVTHIIVPILLLSLFRDIFYKSKAREKFPLHYILIGGLAGALPDIDIFFYYALSYFDYTFNELHRVFSHSLSFLFIFLFLGILTYFFSVKNKELGRHHLKINKIFFVISFGIFLHLVLDVIFYGTIMPFYPFFYYPLGLNLISYLPSAIKGSIVPVIDAALLIIYLIYLELKHKISDFI